MTQSPPKYPSFLKSLHQSSDYSDLGLKLHGKLYKVHRNIVCSQSAVLAEAMRMDCQESRADVVNVDNHFKVDALKRMIEYLYTGAYRPNPTANETIKSTTDDNKVDDGSFGSGCPKGDSAEESDNAHLKRSCTGNFTYSSRSSSELSFHRVLSDFQSHYSVRNQKPVLMGHLEVYLIADHYQIQGLKDLSVANLKSFFEENWILHINSDTPSKVASNGTGGNLVKVLDGAMLELEQTGDTEEVYPNQLQAVNKLRKFLVEMDSEDLSAIGESQVISSNLG